MFNEKTTTDQWVRKEIDNLGVHYTEQGTDIKEVKAALKGASKTGGKGSGKPEFVFVLGETLVVVEDKPKKSELVKYDEKGAIDLTVPDATEKYALNGAVHYAKYITKYSRGFEEVLAIGATGDKQNRDVEVWVVSYNSKTHEHTCKPVKNPKIRGSWGQFKTESFAEWYGVNVLGNLTQDQKDELELKSFAAKLHEDLRNYANLEGENKATVVSAILLALFGDERQGKELKGKDTPNDGTVLYRAIDDYMKHFKISPEFKVSVVMEKFTFLKSNVALNRKLEVLGDKTPLRYYTEQLESVMAHFKRNTEFDILGNFYGEFTKYGGSDGNGLGIVLTPKHITSLMTELIDIKRDDYVLDPTAGSGAFLISAMKRMLNQPVDDYEKKYNDQHIRKSQLFGIEMQEKMYTVATTNMILRGDGKSNLMLDDMFSKEVGDVKTDGKGITKILMNPPYSQGSKRNPKLYEINFIKHALSLMSKEGKLAVIVPQSTMTGKSVEERQQKKEILDKHTLNCVITLNPNTFAGQRAGVQPVIAIFTAHKSHPSVKPVKFINFKDDGYVIKKQVGLVDDGSAVAKRLKLVDVVINDVEEENDFLVKACINENDEWLHSSFYYNDQKLKRADLIEGVKKYLSFELTQKISGNSYLFQKNSLLAELGTKEVRNVSDISVQWKTFKISEVFDLSGTKTTPPSELVLSGKTPRVTTAATNNGLDDFYGNRPTEKGGVLTIDSATEGFVTYQPYDFISTDHVEKLQLKKQKIMTAHLGIYLVQAIRNATKNKYSYGYKFSQKRIYNQIILLPTVDLKEPAWDYMSEQISEITSNIIKDSGLTINP